MIWFLVKGVVVFRFRYSEWEIALYSRETFFVLCVVFSVCAISYLGLGLLFSFFAALSFSNSSGHITGTTSSHGAAATPRIWRDGGLMSAKRESDQPAVSDRQRQLPNNIFFVFLLHVFLRSLVMDIVVYRRICRTIS